MGQNDVEMFGKMVIALQHIEECKEFGLLIPEVRTNLVYAKAGAQTSEEVLGIDGRITTVNAAPQAAGRLKFGASSHMARLVIELNRRDPSVRAGINFAAYPDFIRWLKNYCENKGWIFSYVDRSKEPEDVREAEGASMPWKVEEAVKNAGGRIPKVFYETGGVGKEDVAVLVGNDPIEVAKQICEIAKAYSKVLNPPPKTGKIDLDIFKTFILKRLGKRKESVIVPPFTGIDAGVIDIGNDRVLIVAEDPIFSIPGQPLEMFGWYTVHIGASDVAVMGVKPEYMTYTLLLPPGTPDEDLKTIIDSIHRTAEELDIAILGGHTGYYPGFVAPTIGGITVFAVADRNSYVTPAGAKPGDDVILTKGPAIETAGILAVLREEELLERYSKKVVERAKSLCKEMTVVKDALIAMEVGGVTAMHDATEGGVMGGLFEIANASGVGMEIDESLFIFPDEVKIVCDAFEIDPVKAIAEGSLLITSNPESSEKIIEKLNENGINASVIGRVTDDPTKRIMKRMDGSVIPLEIPQEDPFWRVFFESVERMMGESE
jgi:hydrogenase maturation factor/predicted fused transcriptional regulator/phosphomethylpyrimidine kinase